jgi:carboxypeptidase family protein
MRRAVQVSRRACEGKVHLTKISRKHRLDCRHTSAMPGRRVVGVLAAAALALCGGLVRSSGQQPQTTAPAATGLIAGQVVDGGSRRPIDGVTITLIPRGLSALGRASVPPGTTAIPLPRPVVVDGQGRFFFSGLVGGVYTLQASKPGFAPVSPAGAFQEIEIAPAERILDLKIRLIKLGSLTGTVRDDAGDPVVGMFVVAAKRVANDGRVTMEPAGAAKTDDRGAFRLFQLPPGEYVICACMPDSLPLDGLLLTSLASDPVQLMSLAGRAVKSGADAASLDNTLRTFAPTFYPSSPSIARATRLKLGVGEDRTGADIDVTAVRATRVSGTIVGANSPLDARSITLWPAESGDEAIFSVLRPMLVQPDGRFDFAGVPPGQYVLRVNHLMTSARGGSPSGTALAFVGSRASAMSNLIAGPVGDDALRWAAEPITVGESGASGVIIDLRQGTRIRGRVEFVGAAPQPSAQALQRAALVLQSTDSRVSGGSGSARVNADLTFQTARVTPGRYSIFSTGFPGWPTLKSVIAGGHDVTDQSIALDADDVTDVVMTFSDAPQTTLDVTVLDSRVGEEDLRVLVFPSERKYWSDMAAARRRFQWAPTGRKGNAKLAGLPAGEYFVAVDAADASVDWQEASRLDALSNTAQRVTLADGEKRSLVLRR